MKTIDRVGAEDLDSIPLVLGTAGEITQALKQLGASPSTIAKASVSFLVKLPGAIVSRVEGGFQVGHSILPEMVAVSQVESTVQGKLQKLMTIPAVNDERFALAA